MPELPVAGAGRVGVPLSAVEDGDAARSGRCRPIEPCNPCGPGVAIVAAGAAGVAAMGDAGVEGAVAMSGRRRPMAPPLGGVGALGRYMPIGERELGADEVELGDE